MNNENMEMNQQQNNQTGTQTPPPAAQSAGGMNTPPYYGRDPRSLGQYAVDKGIDAVGKGVDRLEQDKPGSRRKLAGAICLGICVTSGIAGGYLMGS